jgi:hypothetical protein
MNTLLSDDLEPILDFALPLYDLGFSISPPIPPHGKVPSLPWKEYQTERASKKRLIEWAFDYPYWNYGVITGSLSGIVCIDADNPQAEAVIAKHCPPTPMRQVSGSGRGQHQLYRHPGSHVPTRKNLTVHGVEVKGLDLRGDGGLFVGPGSLHRLTKQPYQIIAPWTKEMLEAVPVFDMNWLGLDAEPPRRLSEEAGPVRGDISLSRKQEYAREFLKGKTGSTAGQGAAESYCFALASALVHGFDLTPEEAEDLLLGWGEQESNTDAHGGYYPWQRSEIRHKLEDAARQEDPQGRPSGYLLPAWDHQAVAAVFERRGPGKPFKAPIGSLSWSQCCKARRTRWCRCTLRWPSRNLRLPNLNRSSRPLTPTIPWAASPTIRERPTCGRAITPTIPTSGQESGLPGASPSSKRTA